MQTICVKTKEIDINDPLFERKIEIATDGLSHDCFNSLYERVAKLSKENAAIVADYAISMKTEITSSDYYRRDAIVLLSKFSVFFSNLKSFKSVTREEILSFLDSFRKPESVDPLHKWMARTTYTQYT
jgi:hypothetical protein